MTRRSVIGALVGLAFAAAAGVGLAQVTTGSTPSLAVTSTTESQTTSTQTTGDFEGKSAVDQESEVSDFESDGNNHKHQSSTTLSTTSTTTPLTTSTTGDGAGDAAGNGQEKMDVCHKTGSGKEHTINIAAPAVPAHVAHGDTLGACALVAATTSLSTTTTATTTTATPTTATTTTSATSHGQKSHKPKKPKKVQSSNHGKSNHGKGHNK
jgi:hypothetical protein